MLAEYDQQQILEALVVASQWNSFKLTETHQENVKEQFLIWWHEDQILFKVSSAGRQQATPALLLLLWPKQQRKEWEGRGRERERLYGG